VLLDWAAQAERADAATEACRRRLTASITAGAEDGEGLGSALGLDGLVADDAFRATDPVAQFAALGAAAQLLVASSAGAFPPPTATSPAGMAAAWTQLSAVQQEALIQLRPGLVGALDGLPTLIRDRANRILLAGGIEDREQMLATAAASGNTALVAELERQLTGMVALQHQLGQQDVGGVPTPVYLMSFDNIQVDRVAVAVGNPDTAATVGVFVPGTGNDLGSVPGNVGRAADLLTQTRGAGAADSAVVMWLGYDAPDGLQQAAEDTAADAGAEPFAEFLSGLRAAHPGEPASVTAVLHSYAALLGAQAAARYSLELDQMVLVGATGTDLPSVTDMQIAGVPAEAVGSRVVALTMATDPILYSGAVHPGMPQDPSFGAQSIVLPGPPLDVGDIAASIVTDGVMASVPGLGVIVGPAPAVWDAEAHSAYFTDPAAMALLGQLIARRFP
jgi:pimeloyl-ACP methyl ester carboxylesterase